MHKFLLALRTVCHLKPIQVINRISRKFLPKGAQTANEVAEPLPEFTFLNQTARPNGWNDPTLPKLWLYNLHYFEYLNEAQVEERGRQWKENLILRWIKENPKGCGNGWEPYPISLRVVNWIKWLGVEWRRSRSSCEVDGGGEKKGEEEIRRSLAEQVEWLSNRLEYHLLANHLLANAKALLFAGVALGVEKWYRKGLSIYRKELPEQICADGVHFERSAMYHSIILEDVLDCVKVVGDQRFLRDYAEKMLAGLELLTGPDGKIVKFNDAADGIAKSPAELLAYARELGLTPVASPSSRDSGFARITRGTRCLVAKCGPIGPDYQPGHAHADTGSFELWNGDVKIVTDTGTDRYVVDAERKRQRGTAAHNTVMIDGRDSSEVWAGHRVARRAKSEGWSVDGASLALAYRDYSGFRIRRTLELTEDGVRGADEIRGSGEHEIELRWHFAPGQNAQIRCEQGAVSLEPAMICEEFGKQSESRVAIVRVKTTLPTTVRWVVLI